MNVSIKSIVYGAHLKAAGTMVVILMVVLVAAVFAAKRDFEPKAAEMQNDVSSKTRPERSQSLPTNSPSSGMYSNTIPVEIMAPTIESRGIQPAYSKEAAAISNDKNSVLDGDKINLGLDMSQTTRKETNLDSGDFTRPLESSSEACTNFQLTVSVKYVYAAIEKSLQTGQGELVAVCRKTGVQDTVAIVECPMGDICHLRKASASDHLANLGLRLSKTDGDLSKVEQLIRATTGVEEVVFYFAPVANFARQIVSSQQAEIAKLVGKHGPNPSSERVLLSARLDFTEGGTPRYWVTSVSVSEHAP